MTTNRGPSPENQHNAAALMGLQIFWASDVLEKLNAEAKKVKNWETYFDGDGEPNSNLLLKEMVHEGVEDYRNKGKKRGIIMHPKADWEQVEKELLDIFIQEREKIKESLAQDNRISTSDVSAKNAINLEEKKNECNLNSSRLFNQKQQVEVHNPSSEKTVARVERSLRNPGL